MIRTYLHVANTSSRTSTSIMLPSYELATNKSLDHWQNMETSWYLQHYAIITIGSQTCHRHSAVRICTDHLQMRSEQSDLDASSILLRSITSVPGVVHK